MNAAPQLTRGVVLDLDSLGPSDLNLSALRQCLPQWSEFASTEAHQVIARAAHAQVIITNKVVIDATAIDACHDLQLICVAATGSNNVDLQAAAARGIRVCNVRNYGPQAVAQHALMLMLNLATHAFDYNRDACNGRWSKSPFFCLLDHPIIELAGKTLGIVGYGAIGQQLAKMARALDMNILISARPDAGTIATDRVAFDDVIASADVISLHCPLTPATQQLINAERLAQMKPTALLINCARGGLIDEVALAQALRSGQIAGAGLDGLSVEPPPAAHPLLADIPNLIVTPHSAWAARESRQRLVDILTANINGFKTGNLPNSLV